MKEQNVVVAKSYAFAVRVVKVHKYLSKEKHEFVLGKQLLRSGTSIGANVEEAVGGHSRKDFAAKMNIAYKEARESHYWIRLLTDTDYLPPEHSVSLLREAEELQKILGSILKTVREQP